MKLLLFALCLTSILALETVTTTPYMNTELIKIPTYNCEIAVSDDLVGFYCPTQKLLFYNLRSEWDVNNPQTVQYKDISGTSNAYLHKGSPNFIITAGLESTNQFTVGRFVGGKIRSYNYWVIGYNPELFTFNIDSNILVQVASSQFSSSYVYWMIGKIADSSYKTVYLRRKDKPQGMALRSLSSSTARLYYTKADTNPSNPNSFILYKEDVKLNWDLSNESYIGINTVCGSHITVNSDLIVVGCPSSTSSTDGKFTVLKESDFSTITTVTSTSGLYSISGRTAIISSSYYHQIYYSSVQGASSIQGQMSLLEIFVNRKDSTDYKIKNHANAHTESGYNTFAKYFDLDSQTNKLYISSYRKNTNPTFQGASVLQVCTHDQTYNSATKSCTNVGSIGSSLTIGLQDATAVA